MTHDIKFSHVMTALLHTRFELCEYNSRKKYTSSRTWFDHQTVFLCESLGLGTQNLYYVFFWTLLGYSCQSLYYVKM